MSSIGTHIAAVRVMLNKYSETEVPHTDEAIYHHLSTAAAYFMRQKYDKTNVVNFQNIKFYPIRTERGSLVDCGCVGACEVLKTKYTIPRMIVTRSGPILQVRTLDMKEIPYVDMNFISGLEYDETRKGRIHYSLINNTIYLHNTDLSRPKAIFVGGIAVDTTQWKDVKICPDGDEVDVCARVFDLDMPIDEDIVDAVYTQVVQKLVDKSPDDRVNQGSNG